MSARLARPPDGAAFRGLLCAVGSCLLAACFGKSQTPKEVVEGGVLPKVGGVDAGLGDAPAGTDGSAPADSGAGDASAGDVSGGDGGSTVTSGGPFGFTRTDYPGGGGPSPGGPESVAVADLDGKNGPDIVVALPGRNAIGVMLNKGDGTFGTLQTVPACSQAISIALGDITSAAGTFGGDGKVDAVVACSPDVGVLSGNGDGTFAVAKTYPLGVAQPLGVPTNELVRLARLTSGGPLSLILQASAPGPSPRYVCASNDFNPSNLICETDVKVGGPLGIGRLDPALQDQVATGTVDNKLVVFGMTAGIFINSVRDQGPVQLESVAFGDLNGDGYPDILMGHLLNSVALRVSGVLTFHLWNPTATYGIAPNAVASSLWSIPGLDAIAIADIDGDGHNDILGIGDYGRGIVHLGDGMGGFDSGHDVPLIGYQNPATATRTTLALADLNCDGQPDVAVSDELNDAISVLVNTTRSKPAAACK